MNFNLEITLEAKKNLKKIKKQNKIVFKAIISKLKLLQNNPKHPSLQTYQYKSLKGPNGEKVFEAYVQNNTPNAYRIFFCYESKNTIVIIAIVPHPYIKGRG